MRYASTSVLVVCFRLMAQSALDQGALDMEFFTDRPGLDYKDFELAARPELCQIACSVDARCKAYTYVKPGAPGNPAHCWLKSGLPSPVRDECCISGQPKLHIANPPTFMDTEFGVNRPGGDYSNFDLPRPQPDLCRTACANDNRCQTYTYVKPGVQGPNARCWLKSSVPSPEANDCCISAVQIKTGLLGLLSFPTIELGYNRPGIDFKRFDLSADKPGLCHLACAELPGCTAYSYVKPGVEGPNARCHLKNGIPAQVPDACCVSGVHTSASATPTRVCIYDAKGRVVEPGGCCPPCMSSNCPDSRPPECFPPGSDERQRAAERLWSEWGSRICNEPSQHYSFQTSNIHSINVKCLGDARRTIAAPTVRPLPNTCELDSGERTPCVLDARRRFLNNALETLSLDFEWHVPPDKVRDPKFGVPSSSPGDDLANVRTIIDATLGHPGPPPCNHTDPAFSIPACYDSGTNTIFLLQGFWARARTSPIAALGILVHEAHHTQAAHNCPARLVNGNYVPVPGAHQDQGNTGPYYAELLYLHYRLTSGPASAPRPLCDELNSTRVRAGFIAGSFLLTGSPDPCSTPEPAFINWILMLPRVVCTGP